MTTSGTTDSHHLAGVLRVVHGAQSSDQCRFRALGDAVQHIHLQAALHAEQRGQCPDRSGPRHQHPLRLEPRPAADPFHLFPRLGHDRRRLQQHPDALQAGIELDRVVRLHAPHLRAVAVDLLDAPLGVLAVAAHVELAARASAAGHRIGPANHTDDQINGREPATGRCLTHTAERLVSQHHPITARWRPTVGALDDFLVRTADPHRDTVHQNLSFLGGRLGKVADFQRVLDMRTDGQCAHRLPFSVRQTKGSPGPLPTGCRSFPGAAG